MLSAHCACMPVPQHGLCVPVPRVAGAAKHVHALLALHVCACASCPEFVEQLCMTVHQHGLHWLSNSQQQQQQQERLLALLEVCLFGTMLW